MQTQDPLFSIILPTYNRAHLIGETIHSILKQEWREFELWVVDDGSTDDTEAVVSQFADERVHYVKKENGERGAARNYGAARARGKYFNFFDSDDLMYANHLKVAKAIMEEYNGPEFFHLGYDFKTPDGTITHKVNDLNEVRIKDVFFDNFLSCNGVFVRGDIAKKYPFEENRDLASAEDWELWIRLLSRYPLRFSNEITSSVICHENRSIRTIPTSKVLKRDLLLIALLRKDKVVMAHYGLFFRRFCADRYTYLMLCFAEDRRIGRVLYWSVRASAAYPLILFSKRFLASIKNAF